MTENSTTDATDATDTPAWAYLRAYEMSHGKAYYSADYIKDFCSNSFSPEGAVIRAFAAYIAKNEQKPVDPLLLEARKIVADVNSAKGHAIYVRVIMAGGWDHKLEVVATLAGLRRGKELAQESAQ